MALFSLGRRVITLTLHTHTVCEYYVAMKGLRLDHIADEYTNLDWD